MKKLKVALVHEFLNQFGGAERVLEAFVELFPEAEIYTLLYDPAKMHGKFEKVKINTSFLQKFAGLHKYLLPLMPKAIESIKIPTDIDLVLSDASAFAKGVKVPQGIPHLCYLHTPTRYLWIVRDEYINSALPNFLRPFKFVVDRIVDRQRVWDYLAAQKPDLYIANSKNISQKLSNIYDRDSDSVVFPFVDLDQFYLSQPDDYVLALGRMEPYKKFDLAIEAATKVDQVIKVVGTGTRFNELVSKYKNNSKVEFLGRVEDKDLKDLYAKAKVYIFPQEEDAGITPLEAMASGCPVLAYGKGGALESVQEGVSGHFFEEQTVDSIADKLVECNWNAFDRARVRESVRKFDIQSFKEKILTEVEKLI
ncbi:glycosyltransferase [Candidatus Berkelbacteria bacterium]|nr:glycosyltransferase [Candidatus Berkelbacteria bacterium]